MTLVDEAKIPRRDRYAALAGLIGVTAVAWLYLWIDAARMASMPGNHAGMSMTSALTVESLALTFVMWSVMMVAMMLPSATPAILLYQSIVAKNREAGSTLPSTGIFAAGYLTTWTAFSLAAAILHAALQAIGFLTPMMVSASAWLSGGILILAGTYQWLPLKEACLLKCQAPLPFLLFHWRPGSVGTFRLGALHGLFCVGCCWALMLLLFTAGVMNLLWVALISGFVFVEKLLPSGKLVGRLAGIGLILAGAVLIAGRL